MSSYGAHVNRKVNGARSHQHCLRHPTFVKLTTRDPRGHHLAIAKRSVGHESELNVPHQVLPLVTGHDNVHSKGEAQHLKRDNVTRTSAGRKALVVVWGTPAHQA